MRDWMYATKDEIEHMTFDEAAALVQKHIDLGHTNGDFRPREHFTKALEIVLAAAKKNV